MEQIIFETRQSGRKNEPCGVIKGRDERRSEKGKSFKKKMIKVPPQIMTSYDRIANERPVYTVIDQW